MCVPSALNGTNILRDKKGTYNSSCLPYNYKYRNAIRKLAVAKQLPLSLSLSWRLADAPSAEARPVQVQQYTKKKKLGH